jgi:hypothetical protein
MDYILGAGLLFAAVLTIAVGRIFLNLSATTADDEAFGAAEGIAVLFTVILAMAIAVIARQAFAEASFASLAQMVGALVGAVVLSVVAWKALARLAPPVREAGAAEGPPTPDRGRPHRPAGTDIRGGRRPQAKRAA